MKKFNILFLCFLFSGLNSLLAQDTEYAKGSFCERINAIVGAGESHFRQVIKWEQNRGTLTTLEVTADVPGLHSEQLIHYKGKLITSGFPEKSTLFKAWKGNTLPHLNLHDTIVDPFLASYDTLIRDVQSCLSADWTKKKLSLPHIYMNSASEMIDEGVVFTKDESPVRIEVRLTKIAEYQIMLIIWADPNIQGKDPYKEEANDPLCNALWEVMNEGDKDINNLLGDERVTLDENPSWELKTDMPGTQESWISKETLVISDVWKVSGLIGDRMSIEGAKEKFEYLVKMAMGCFDGVLKKKKLFPTSFDGKQYVFLFPGENHILPKKPYIDISLEDRGENGRVTISVIFPE